LSRTAASDLCRGKLVVGTVTPATDFDPDKIVDLFWTAHTDSKDDWQTEYRFTGG
jgi:hypothetical protein